MLVHPAARLESESLTLENEWHLDATGLEVPKTKFSREYFVNRSMASLTGALVRLLIVSTGDPFVGRNPYALRKSYLEFNHILQKLGEIHE